MIENILVPTDGSEYARLGVRYAVALAKRHNAAIRGLYVTDVKLLEGPFLRDLSASLGTAPYVNYQGNIAMILEERGKAALRYLRDICEENGIACTTEQTSGIVHRTIIEHSGLVDLIVLGRGGEHSDFLDGLLGSTTEAVVRRASTPVIVTNTESFKTGAILAAYDSSLHAQHALKLARQLAETWGAALHVVIAGATDAEAREASAGAFLEGLPAVSFWRVSEEPGDAIVGKAESVGADLVVMGAYGHSKVRELVVGSTTTHVVNHAPCPVLLVRTG